MRTTIKVTLELPVKFLSGPHGTQASTQVNIGIRKRKMYPIAASGPGTVSENARRLKVAVKQILEGTTFDE